MKYGILKDKFFIKVPVAANQKVCYLCCYLYGYIKKKGFVANFEILSENLELSIHKTKQILKLLKEKKLIFIDDKKIYPMVEEEVNYFLNYNNIISYDITFLPNLDYISIIDNALYWKLYKYSEPVEGMNNCYTIGSKSNLKKIEDKYLSDILGISGGALKRSIQKLRKLKLIKIKREGESFYFGIQPIKTEMKEFWRNQDCSYESKSINQKDILEIYANYAKFYIKEIE